MREWKLAQLRCRLETSGILVTKLEPGVKEVSGESVRGLISVLQEAARLAPELYWLIDLADCTGVDEEARKLMRETRKVPYAALICYGGTLGVRALLSVVIRTRALLGNSSGGVFSLVKDEAEARAKVMEVRRAKVSAKITDAKR